MADPLMNLVEKRLQSSLSLQTFTSTESHVVKPPPPVAILNSPDGSPVAHLFKISPQLQNSVDVSSSPKTKFGVVTLNGSITIYDTMFRRILMKRKTRLERVSWGSLCGACTSPDLPTFMIYSRQSGFYNLKLSKEGDNNDDSEPNLLTTETHAGFCKPYLCQDQQQVIVPIGSEKIGLLVKDQCQEFISPCFTFSSTIMACKEMGNEGGSKYIMVTTEDGYVNVVKYPQKSEEKCKALFISKFLLPNHSQGVCIEGDGTNFVIGTNLKAILMLKWIPEEMKLHPVGKKALPTEGVSCLALQKEKNERLLAAGCFDGTIRIFQFPNMTQISTIQYHSSQINSLVFVNDEEGKDKIYLLCGASDNSGVSVWKI